MHAQLPGDAMWTCSQLMPQPVDRLDDMFGQRMWRPSWTAGAVSQACVPLGLESLPPLRNRAARYALGLSHLGLGPARQHTFNNKPTTRECELPASMGQERSSY